MQVGREDGSARFEGIARGQLTQVPPQPIQTVCCEIHGISSSLAKAAAASSVSQSSQLLGL